MGINQYGQIGGVDQGARSNRFTPWTEHYGTRWAELGEDATAGEFLKAGGLDWEVTARPLSDFGALGDVAHADEHVVVIGNNTVLGTFKNGYTTIQNSEVADMAQLIVDLGRQVGKDLSITTAFSMHHGKVVVICISAGDTDFGGGVLTRNLTVVTAHDGTIPFATLPSVVVSQCMNTLGLNMRRESFAVKVKHTKNAEQRISEAKQGLVAAFHGWESFDKVSAELLAMQLPQSDFVGKFIRKVIGERPDAEGNAATRWDNLFDSIVAEYRAEHNEYAANTAWGAVMAVNGHELWKGTLRSSKGEPPIRWERQMDGIIKQSMGSATNLTARALELVGV